MHRPLIASFIALPNPRARRARRLLPLMAGSAAFYAPTIHAQPALSPAPKTGIASKIAARPVSGSALASDLVSGSNSGVVLNASIRLAQLAPGEGRDPAATPDETQPGVLRVPVGPEQTPAIPAPPPPDENTATAPPLAPTPGGGGLLDTTPDQAPIIGDVRAAEGREISEVRVVGNRVVPAETVLGQVRSQRGAAFSSRQTQLDRARIGQLGFFASVQTQVAPDLTDPTKIVVTYIVVENRVISGFKFVGNTVLKTEEISPILSSKVGTVLNRAMVSADVAAIQKFYQDKGYAVLVQSAQQDEDGTLVFTLSEAVVSKINLTGLKKTRESLIRRQIRLKVGDRFSAANLRRDLNRLYDTNFFDAVDPKVEDDPDQAGAVTVTFVFREKRTGQFSVGVGFDSRSKLSGFFTLSESNLRGTGQRGFASVEVGAQQNFELGTGNPFIGDKNASYDASIYRRSIYREPRLVQRVLNGTDTTDNLNNLDNITFEEQRTGGRFNFTRPLDYDRRRTLIFGYRNERARLIQRDNITIDGTSSGTVVDNTLLNSKGTISAASLGFLHDSRDLRIEPSSGGRESIVVEQAVKFLGNTSFTKLDLDVRRYIPLIKAEKLGAPAKLVLAGRGVLGRSLNQLPAFEQYYIGGTETVRGYNTEQQYGDNQLYGNLELRYRFQPRITGVLFVDSGTAYGGQISTSGSANFLTSYGFGVRLVTPVGPIRLDYGIGRDGGRTHFGIGSTF